MEQFISPDKSSWDALLARPTATYDDLEPLVAEVFEAVKTQGDAAVRGYTQKFDGVAREELRVSPAEIAAAVERVPQELKDAILLAKRNIERFHQAQITAPVKVTTQTGVSCWQEKRPIQKVGLYIPGGSAPLFSTILMLAVPAQIAGCQEIILCSPPDKNGALPDVVLYTAQLCGITQIFTVGGIQAIAAMTFGTESIPNVYKLFGPGNQYVTVAKQWATRFNMAIDMPAVQVNCWSWPTLRLNRLCSGRFTLTSRTRPRQSSHLSDYCCSYIAGSTNGNKATIERFTRKTIAEKAIANSKMIAFESDEEAIDFINQYGPEHYIICMENEENYINAIENAGSVFVGNYTPESAGDYASEPITPYPLTAMPNNTAV